MSFSHPESAASLLVAYYSDGLAEGTAEGGGIPQPAGAGSRCPSRLPSDLAFVPHPRPVPGVLQGSATGQQSCSRSRGNRRRSLSGRTAGNAGAAAPRPQSAEQLCVHAAH